MTLYDEIKRIEERKERLKQSVDYLTKESYLVKVNLPDVRQEAQALLLSEKYKDNLIVQRIRQGENLGEITNEIIRDRKWKTKIKKKERERYNKRVTELEAILPRAELLKVNPIYNVREAEGMAGFLTVTGSILMPAIHGLIYLGSGFDNRLASLEELPEYIALGAFFGLLCGTAAASAMELSQTACENIMRKVAKYIDEKLGK